jgi:hypothetical protein
MMQGIVDPQNTGYASLLCMITSLFVFILIVIINTLKRIKVGEKVNVIPALGFCLVCLAIIGLEIIKAVFHH